MTTVIRLVNYVASLLLIVYIAVIGILMVPAVLIRTSAVHIYFIGIEKLVKSPISISLYVKNDTYQILFYINLLFSFN